MDTKITARRPARYPAWLERTFRALRAVARFFSTPVVAIPCGVVAPAAWLVLAWDLIGRGLNVGIAALFAAAMTCLSIQVLVRPRARRVSIIVAGGLIGATAVGGGLTALLAPFLLSGAVLPLYYDHIDWELDRLVVNVVPLLGSLTYACAAWLAWSRLERPSRSLLAVGCALPLGLCVIAQGTLSLGIRHCVRTLLADDRERALEAADRCRAVPRSIVSWRPVVDAWIEAKGGRPRDPENERSNRIADVFERLTGHDLRRSYDSSNSY